MAAHDDIMIELLHRSWRRDSRRGKAELRSSIPHIYHYSPLDLLQLLKDEYPPAQTQDRRADTCKTWRCDLAVAHSTSV